MGDFPCSCEENPVQRPFRYEKYGLRKTFIIHFSTKKYNERMAIDGGIFVMSFDVL